MLRRSGRRLVGALLGIGAAVAVLWVPLWLWAPPAWRPGWALLALTPLAVVGAVLVGLVALGTRRWVVGALAVVAALVLAGFVAPRAVAHGAPAGVPVAAAPRVVVATANLRFGLADAGQLVALVRSQHVDVLALEELTPDAEARLASAGLFAELPFRDTEPRRLAAGTGMAARYPLVPSGIALRPATFAEVTARVLIPGLPLDVVVTHPSAPLFRPDPEGWAQEITGLPGPATGAGPARVVMGDLNATLDHRPLRDLLARGHRDAAAELGDGLVPTWPTDEPVPPFATIDHLLLSGPVVPRALAAHRIAGTDHTAVVATLTP